MTAILKSALAAALVLFSPSALPARAKADVMVSGMVPNLCLDVNGQTRKVALWSCHGGVNQNFFTSAYGAQQYNGLCLDAGGQGSDLYMEVCANKPSQRWALTSQGVLRNEGGWCADIPNAQAFQGQRVTAWQCNNGRNQTWARGSFRPGGATGAAAQARPGAILSPAGALIGQASGIVSTGGGSLVASGGGNLVASGGGNLVATGGGNVLVTNGGALVASGGGN